MTEHTPTPWTLNDDDMLFARDEIVGDLRFLATPNHRANATFIVKAVNNHGALVKALTEMLEGFEPFTSKPMGAPGSDARNQQQLQIAAHRNAREALARLNPPVGQTGSRS